jgi:hypothetical protein
MMILRMLYVRKNITAQCKHLCKNVDTVPTIKGMAKMLDVTRKAALRRFVEGLYEHADNISDFRYYAITDDEPCPTDALLEYLVDKRSEILRLFEEVMDELRVDKHTLVGTSVIEL